MLDVPLRFVALHLVRLWMRRVMKERKTKPSRRDGQSKERKHQQSN